MDDQEQDKHRLVCIMAAIMSSNNSDDDFFFFFEDGTTYLMSKMALLGDHILKGQHRCL